MNNYFVLLSLFTCIFALISVSLSLYACIIAKSLERATHTVQMVPVTESQINDFANEKEFEEVNTEQKDENDSFFRMV